MNNRFKTLLVISIIIFALIFFWFFKSDSEESLSLIDTNLIEQIDSPLAKSQLHFVKISEDLGNLLLNAAKENIKDNPSLARQQLLEAYSQFGQASKYWNEYLKLVSK